MRSSNLVHGFIELPVRLHAWTLPENSSKGNTPCKKSNSSASTAANTTSRGHPSAKVEMGGCRSSISFPGIDADCGGCRRLRYLPCLCGPGLVRQGRRRQRRHRTRHAPAHRQRRNQPSPAVKMDETLNGLVVPVPPGSSGDPRRRPAERNGVNAVRQAPERASGSHFVIVGAGSAGCVLADRLSADPAIRAVAGSRRPRFELPLPHAGGFFALMQAGKGNYETVPQAGDETAAGCNSAGQGAWRFQFDQRAREPRQRRRLRHLGTAGECRLGVRTIACRISRRSKTIPQAIPASRPRRPDRRDGDATRIPMNPPPVPSSRGPADQAIRSTRT